jgi:curved DNA-binding protein CbpA
MELDPIVLNEDVDLDVETKKKILFLSSKMDEMTHYEVLEVGRRADAHEIKKAYFSVSRNFHPDTFFRKTLGSYQALIEQIFKRVTRAFETLSNEEKRKAYDSTLPYEPTPEEIEEQRKAAEQAEADRRLKEERRQRWLKRSPKAVRSVQAGAHHQEAMEFKKKGDQVHAANAIRLALALDPENADYKKLLEEVEPKASAIRSEQDFKRARYEESLGNPEEALKSYLRAIEANPRDSRALHRAAVLMMELHLDLRQAITFCRQAQQLDADNVEIIATLADLYAATGMNRNAVRELARYLNLRPTDEEVQKRMQELKKKLK